MQKNKESTAMTHGSRQEMSRPEQIRQGPHLHPDVDIVDGKEEIVVRADMPGVGQDAVEVHYENGILTLSGRRKQEASDQGDFLIQEFEPSDFYREFMVGDGIEQDKVSADYDNGVLTLHLPKSEPQKSRKIEVKQAAK